MIGCWDCISQECKNRSRKSRTSSAFSGNQKLLSRISEISRTAVFWWFCACANSRAFCAPATKSVVWKLFAPQRQNQLYGNRPLHREKLVRLVFSVPRVGLRECKQTQTNILSSTWSRNVFSSLKWSYFVWFTCQNVIALTALTAIP